MEFWTFDCLFISKAKSLFLQYRIFKFTLLGVSSLWLTITHNNTKTHNCITPQV